MLLHNSCKDFWDFWASPYICSILLFSVGQQVRKLYAVNCSGDWTVTANF